MISGIQGTLVRLGASSAFVLAGGLEYEVHVPLSVYDALEKQGSGSDVHLFIHHHFSQEDQKLFGFADASEREVFRELIRLQGMGPALALSVLSHYDGPKLLSSCESGDVQGLTQIPRVGKKTAERLIFEITSRKERFRKLLAGQRKGPPPETEQDLAREALLQLGYREAAIAEAFKKLDAKPRTASEWIASSLRVL